MVIKISKYKNYIIDYLFYIVGCFIYSVGVSMLIAPNKITPGGFTGIATSINYITGFNSSIVLLILNVPLFIISLRKIGKVFLIRTIIVTLILSYTLDFTDKFLPEVITDKLLASIFGGIIAGFGLSLILFKGATTGGVDILAKLINKKLPEITIGTVILICDVFVIVFAAICYKNIESALYSIITIFVSSKITDTVIYGFDKAKIAMIFTDFPEEITLDVKNILHRGVTLFDVTGGYTAKKRKMLLVTVRKYEFKQLYDIIMKNDSNSFIIFSSADSIIGKGFKENL